MNGIDAAQQAALEQAAQWYTRLQCETALPADQQAWQAWLQASAANQWAWQQIERLQSRLHEVPQRLASRTLGLAARGNQRRSILKGIALLLSGSAIGWTSYRQAVDGPWLADYHSAVGERLTVALDDGGELLLNTDSAVDVRYDAAQRLIRLRRGEVMISTGKDTRHRPFYVHTPHGLIQALGTRFSVRLENGRSTVAVYEHQVRITPQQGQPLLLDAGQRSRFNDVEATPAETLDSAQGAWSKGLLIANDQRLDDFVNELARYRHGWLRCDPAVASLRISGTFALDDTDQALRALASALPVKVEQRSRYWLTVTAR